MRTISYAEAHADFAAVCDMVVQARAPVTILPDDGGEPSVIIAAEQWEAMIAMIDQHCRPLTFPRT